MKKLLATGLAIITFIALPVSLALADDKEPSGSREDTQFAYRETGILLAQATTLSRTTVIPDTSNLSGSDSGTDRKISIGGAAGRGVGMVDAGVQQSNCGNGIINAGEECDEGAGNGACPRNCSADCRNNPTCCSMCNIRDHLFIDICSADSCCVGAREWQYVRLSELEGCMREHSRRNPGGLDDDVPSWPNVCGDRLIYDLPGGTEQCDPPEEQGACISGQTCNSSCQCVALKSTPPSGRISPTGEGPRFTSDPPQDTTIPPGVILHPLALCGNRSIDAGEQCEGGVGCAAGQVCQNCLCVGPPPAGRECLSRHGRHPMSVPTHVCCDKECKDLTACFGAYCGPPRVSPFTVADCTAYKAEILAQNCESPAGTCTSAFGAHVMDDASRICCAQDCKGMKACMERFCPSGGDPQFPFVAGDCESYATAIEALSRLGTDLDCPAVAPTCIPNGRPEAGEQCDTFELSESDARAQLLDRCASPADGQEVFNCDMRDCSCAYIQTACAGRTIDGAIVQCRSSLDCASGSICDTNCQCQAVTPPPPPPTPPQPAQRRQDCSVEVISFSSDAAKEKLDQLNKKEIAEITGRTDLDVYVEREQMARVVCVTKAAPQTSSKGTVTYDVTSSWDSIASRPMQLIQTGGSVFIDFNNTDQMQFKRVELVEQPVRILPMEGQTGMSLSEAVPIGTLVPNITSSVSSAGDAANVNNMIEYQGFNLVGGQTFSISASGSVEIHSAEGAPVVSGADRIDVFNFRMPIGCATWTGVEGYAGCVPIEDQIHDSMAVKNFIRSQVIPGEAVKSAVVYGAPWEKIDNFTFILDRGAVAGVAEPGAATTGFGVTSGPANDIPNDMYHLVANNEHKFALLAADPASLGEGGGGCKGCYVNGAAAGAGEMMPALVALIAAVGGIMAGRKWKKEK